MSREQLRIAWGGRFEIRTGKFYLVVSVCTAFLLCFPAWTAPVAGERNQDSETAPHPAATVGDQPIHQENIPGPLTISLDALRASKTGEITLAATRMRVRKGDEPAWKNPDFGDDGWNVTESLEYPAGGDASQVPFTPVWFRFELRFAPDIIGKPILLQARPYQYNLQVFLNGTRVADPQDLDPSTGATPRCIVPLLTDNVVALRWVPNASRPNLATATANPRKFSLLVHDYARALDNFDRQENLERSYSWHRIALVAVFIVFFLFHLNLYRHYPRRRENVYFCLTALFCALALASLHLSEIYHYDRVIWRVFYLYCFLALMPLCLVSGLGLLQLLFTGGIRWTLPLYGAIGVISFVASFWFGNVPVHFFPVLLLPELVWIIWPRPGRKNMLFGWGVLAAIVMAGGIVSAMVSLYQWDMGSGFLRYASLYSFAVLLQIVSLAFAREYADDKKRIEALAASLEEKIIARTHELNAATAEISTLHGILPICMHCHKIRNDQQSWQQLEQYIQQHSDAHFSHGLCPDCMDKYYPELKNG